MEVSESKARSRGQAEHSNELYLRVYPVRLPAGAFQKSKPAVELLVGASTQPGKAAAAIAGALRPMGGGHGKYPLVRGIGTLAIHRALVAAYLAQNYLDNDDRGVRFLVVPRFVQEVVMMVRIMLAGDFERYGRVVAGRQYLAARSLPFARTVTDVQKSFLRKVVNSQFATSDYRRLEMLMAKLALRAERNSKQSAMEGFAELLAEIEAKKAKREEELARKKQEAKNKVKQDRLEQQRQSQELRQQKDAERRKKRAEQVPSLGIVRKFV
ncbi:unnamed protein product [Symbiodinium sp. CCMP2456]|nr:unnamed protein product [Symbiodinium sp. CCMP2456]